LAQNLPSKDFRSGSPGAIKLPNQKNQGKSSLIARKILVQLSLSAGKSFDERHCWISFELSVLSCRLKAEAPEFRGFFCCSISIVAMGVKLLCHFNEVYFVLVSGAFCFDCGRWAALAASAGG
jgi:hypothetical protein